MDKEVVMGTVYIIKNKVNDLCYVGSTELPPVVRFSLHIIDGYYLNRAGRVSIKFYQQMNKLGVENFYYEELEKVSVEQLTEREKYYIKKLDTIKNGYNTMMPKRTKEEYKQDNKDTIDAYKKKYYQQNKQRINAKNKENYHKNATIHKEKNKLRYEKNKEKYRESQKKYYESNKEKIKQKTSEYQKNNREKRNKHSKDYYERNKEKILEKIECDCGSLVQKHNLKSHQQTKKHKELLKKK